MFRLLRGNEGTKVSNRKGEQRPRLKGLKRLFFNARTCSLLVVETGEDYRRCRQRKLHKDTLQERQKSVQFRGNSGK